EKIEVIIAGTSKTEINNFKRRLAKNNNRAQVKHVKESVFKQSVKLGFEMAQQYKSSSLKSVETAYKRMEKNLYDMQKQHIKIEKENKHIEASRSWKVSLPLRKLGSLVKK